MKKISKVEREKINLSVHDEIIREEIRKRLPADKPNFGIWKILNSTFSVWLLSAVFITGLGAIVEKRSLDQAASSSAKRQKLELDVEIASRIVRSHAYFSIDNYYQAFRILNADRVARSPTLQAAFPVLILRLSSLSDPVPLDLKATLQDAILISSLEGILTARLEDSDTLRIGNEPDVSPKTKKTAIDTYRRTWCRIISRSRWEHLIPNSDKSLHGECLVDGK